MDTLMVNGNERNERCKSPARCTTPLNLPGIECFEDLRARKGGDARKLVKKLEDRYDEEDYLGTPDRAVTWLNEVLDDEHEPLEFPETGGESPGWRNINFWLRDGVALCKCVNKLLVADGKPPIKFHMVAQSAFQALENIECFNRGAVQYGLHEYECFTSIDLYECNKGPFLNVINCINKLGFEANRKGFEPAYEAVNPPPRDASWKGF